MIELRSIHHVAVICSDYQVSKRFYTECLGLRVVAESLRAERHSFKLDLALADGTQLELFSFPSPPRRASHPEACGLRHLAFRVENVARSKAELESRGVVVEAIRTDTIAQRRYTFLTDPDGLPLELYEVQ